LIYDLPTAFTIGDTIKINVTVVNVNSYKVTSTLTTIASDPALTYTLPTATFTVNQKSSISKMVSITASALS